MNTWLGTEYIDENNKRQYRIVFPIVTFKLIIIYNIPNRDVCTYAKCVSLYFKNIFYIHTVVYTIKHIIRNIIRAIKNNYTHEKFYNEYNFILVTNVIWNT